MLKRIVTLVAGSLVMVACGPGAKIDGKQGAADALFAASKPSQAKAESSNTPVDLTGSLTWNCPEGGSAKISGASVNVGSGGVSTGVTMTYNGCGLSKGGPGVAIFEGNMNLSQKIDISNASVNLDQRLKGRVDVRGAYNDFIDADITQKIAVGDLGSGVGGVSMYLVGTITTSDGTFTYDENVNVSGTISARIENNNP